MSQKLNIRPERVLSFWRGMLSLLNWNWEAAVSAQGKKELIKREEEKDNERVHLLSAYSSPNLDILITNV